MPTPEAILMNTMLVREVVARQSTHQPSTLRAILEALDIEPFTPEFVTEHKREKLKEMMCELRPAQGEEIKEHEFDAWEYAELHRLRMDTLLRDLSSDEPVIRFRETRWGQRSYTCLQWVKSPLEKAVDVPEFVKAKAAEIATHLPGAFTVEELRSERRVYDPFLIVSYGYESYYVEVWSESNVERQYGWCSRLLHRALGSVQP
jgi:hypothetical protein